MLGSSWEGHIQPCLLLLLPTPILPFTLELLYIIWGTERSLLDFQKWAPSSQNNTIIVPLSCSLKMYEFSLLSKLQTNICQIHIFFYKKAGSKECYSTMNYCYYVLSFYCKINHENVNVFTTFNDV